MGGTCSGDRMGQSESEEYGCTNHEYDKEASHMGLSATHLWLVCGS